MKLVDHGTHMFLVSRCSWQDRQDIFVALIHIVNRTVKDLLEDSKRFGGASILFYEDFRQTLLVIPKSTAAPADEHIACLYIALKNDPSNACLCYDRDDIFPKKIKRVHNVEGGAHQHNATRHF